MNVIDAQIDQSEASLPNAVKIEEIITAACRSVAPTWPLDRFIAVNPYWGLIDRPFTQAHAELSKLGGSSLFMPREFYRNAFEQHHFSRQHLALVLMEMGARNTADDLISRLYTIDTSAAVLRPFSECLDACRDLQHEPAWSDTITHQISQFCAAYFDDAQAEWQPASRAALYAAWRNALICDHSVAPLMHAPGIAQRAQRLPSSASAMVALALQHFAVSESDRDYFLRVHLLRINGWAAWCAYLRWQARLVGGEDEHVVDLLAMRLSWEWLLDSGERAENSVWAKWRRTWTDMILEPIDSADLAVYQRALELGYQSALVKLIARSPREDVVRDKTIQAIFCIDVRSEVFRRALENVAPTISTHGFAGFFGLPISYTPIGTDATRPQLPGLLSPTLQVSETSGNAMCDADSIRKRRDRLAAKSALQPFQRLPASAFTLVESLGLGYAVKLVQRSLPTTQQAKSCDHDGLRLRDTHRLRPQLQIANGDIQQRADLAQNILGAMSLGNDLARLVVLVGHGSQSANNPHKAGLDCGACCGQTGEVNARALASLLNDIEVRRALRARDVLIPEHTCFVAALHNTTTDEVQLFETECVPATHAQDFVQLKQSLEQAGVQARAERASQLGLAHMQSNADALASAVKRRANDWAQTRPEWGLANNAVFIVAPRSRSQHINLHGRAFLHDYDWQRDGDNSILELIMTAPMIVTHWINMQYHASTVDNQRYGSGNKILHNVVGGHIGVFEGNGGDLRIGLPLQSLHDGARWMHTPLRLSVFIEAPKANIAKIVERHVTVRNLVAGGWLYLFCIDPDSNEILDFKPDEMGELTWSAK